MYVTQITPVTAPRESKIFPSVYWHRTQNNRAKQTSAANTRQDPSSNETDITFSERAAPHQFMRANISPGNYFRYVLINLLLADIRRTRKKYRIIETLNSKWASNRERWERIFWWRRTVYVTRYKQRFGLSLQVICTNSFKDYSSTVHTNKGNIVTFINTNLFLHYHYYLFVDYH